MNQIQLSVDCTCPPAGERTPSFWRTRRRGTPLKAFTGAPVCEMGRPAFALVVGPPRKGQTTRVGGQREKREKAQKDFLRRGSGGSPALERTAHVWGGVLNWVMNLLWLRLALRKGCLLPMPSTMCSLHMQQPPLIHGCHGDTNCERMGHFSLAVQHSGLTCGWDLCWGGATAASFAECLLFYCLPVHPNISLVCLFFFFSSSFLPPPISF